MGWRGEVIWTKSKRKHFFSGERSLHGGGDALLGNRGTGQPVFAETLRVDDDLSHNVKIVTLLYTFTHLRVDDVLPGLHSHVLAHLARVARW